MKWYRDNGVLAWIVLCILILTVVFFVSRCTACYKAFWNANRDEQKLDSLQKINGQKQ